MALLDREVGALWEELGGLFDLCGLCWYVAGDFNVIRSPLEKVSGGHETKSMRRFNDFIEGSQLMDPPLVNERFTWANNRARSRIDRFLFSGGWMEAYGCIRREVGPRVTSDDWLLICKVGAAIGARVHLGLKICGWTTRPVNPLSRPGGTRKLVVIGKDYGQAESFERGF